MACKPCEQRRRMIQVARQRDGSIKGIVTVAPKVIEHIYRNRVWKRRDDSKR